MSTNFFHFSFYSLHVRQAPRARLRKGLLWRIRLSGSSTDRRRLFLLLCLVYFLKSAFTNPSLRPRDEFTQTQLPLLVVIAHTLLPVIVVARGLGSFRFRSFPLFSSTLSPSLSSGTPFLRKCFRPLLVVSSVHAHRRERGSPILSIWALASFRSPQTQLTKCDECYLIPLRR